MVQHNIINAFAYKCTINLTPAKQLIFHKKQRNQYCMGDILLYGHRHSCISPLVSPPPFTFSRRHLSNALLIPPPWTSPGIAPAPALRSPIIMLRRRRMRLLGVAFPGCFDGLADSFYVLLDVIAV